MKTGLAFLFTLIASASSMAVAYFNCNTVTCAKGTTCDPETGKCVSSFIIKKLDADHNVFEVMTENVKSIKIECPEGLTLLPNKKAKEGDEDVFSCQKEPKFHK